MRALVLAPFDPQALAQLQQMGTVTYESWTETRRLYDPETLGQRLAELEADVLITEADFVFSETMERAHQLTLVGLCRGSTYQVDLEAATRSGVAVINTPGRNAQAVAELAFGLMLALVRQIPRAHTYVREGHWHDPVEPYLALRGSELQGKTLGIIGLGTIGRRVARLGRAFGMTVLAYDPYLKGPRVRGALLVDLESLLASSDLLTLHAPATPEPILDKQRLALVRPSAYLVNTADPSLLDWEALAQALRERRLAGAALDVFPSSPVAPTHPILSLGNVVLTPHLGGATAETVQRHSSMMVEDIQRFLEGRRPRRLVNREVWRRRRGR